MQVIQRGAASSKIKRKKTPGLDKKRAEHERYLKSLGVGKTKPNAHLEISCYTEKAAPVISTESICGHGAAKERKIYTGNEIAGIVVTHKSNLMPIRKDNKQAAIDAANMRR